MGSLTPEVNRFVGRRHELAEIKRLLASARLVTLTGIGGAGKTRLARRVAVELERQHYRNRTWFVDLADLHDPDLIGHSVDAAVGIPVQSDEVAFTSLVETIGDQDALLVLDNCEQLLEACAELASTLLGRCPGLRILATSRQAIRLPGEAVVAVPPLSMPKQGRVASAQSLEHYDSVALFLERASAAMPTFRLTDDNAEGVANLVRALEGVPLALELAAARIRVLSPEAMVERLGDRYQLLSKGFRGAPPRQRSLRASVEWSYELCTPEEQALWTRLSVFAGGFGLGMAEAVCSGEGLEREDVLDLLASLVEKSIVSRDDIQGPVTRYRMLETIRQYGMARLAESGRLDYWRNRHMQQYAELARGIHADWVGPRQPQHLARLRRESANIRAVLEHCVSDPERAPLALLMLIWLEHPHLAGGTMSEARHWVELALAHGTGTPVERGMAQVMCAWFGCVQADLDYAEGMLQQAREIAGGADDATLTGYLQATSGVLATLRSQFDQGAQELRQAVDIFERSANQYHLLHTLYLLGLSLGLGGRREEGLAVHHRCVAEAEACGEMFSRSFTLWALGLEALDAGEAGRATELELQAIGMKVELGDQVGVALALDALACVATLEGDAQRGVTLMGAVDPVWTRTGVSLLSIPVIAELRELAGARARERLSERAFRAAWERGQGLTLEQAVAFASSDLMPAAERDAPEAASPLTAREGEVADLVAQGLSNKEIAQRLVISQRTAQGHVENILRKLGFNSRAQVAAWVAERKAE